MNTVTAAATAAFAALPWEDTIAAAQAAQAPADALKLLRAVEPHLSAVREAHATVSTVSVAIGARGIILTDRTTFPDTTDTYEATRWLSIDVLMGHPTSAPEEALHGHVANDHDEPTGLRAWKVHPLAAALRLALASQPPELERLAA